MTAPAAQPLDPVDELRHGIIARAIDEEFSVKTMLNISLVRAKGLKSSQKGKTSLCCQLVGRPYTQLRTDGVNSLSPEWNHTGMIDSCISGDDIQLTVWSEGKATECLGEALLPHEQFHPDGFSGEIALSGGTGKKPATVELKVEVLPVPVTTPKEMRAFVTFVRADDLIGSRRGGADNTYCVCEISGKGDSKVRTKICNGTRNPVWNELHEIDDYEPGDHLELSVYAHDQTLGTDELLGSMVLPSSAFGKRGFAGLLQLRRDEDVAGALDLCIDVGGPSPEPNRRIVGEEEVEALRSRGTSERVNRGAVMHMLSLEDGPSSRKGVPRRADYGPSAHGRHPSEFVTPDDRQPVPFQLRSLDTGRVHRLSGYTVIGRSRSCLDPKHDLILDSPGICDVSRVHAVIKAWPGVDGRAWFARIYDDKNDRGYFRDEEGCRVLVGGGTFVDGQPLEHSQGVEIAAGSVLRFGVNELWVVESAPLHQRLRVAELACRQAAYAEDPESIRDLQVPSQSCDTALKRCVDWISIVRVVLESLHEPDEAPCADCIEVKDECGRPVSRHLATTLEQQEAYDVKRILADVRLGTTVRLRLSSDPCLLAPVLNHLEQVKAKVAETFKSREQFLG